MLGAVKNNHGLHAVNQFLHWSKVSIRIEKRNLRVGNSTVTSPKANCQSAPRDHQLGGVQCFGCIVFAYLPRGHCDSLSGPMRAKPRLRVLRRKTGLERDSWSAEHSSCAAC